MFNSIDLGGTWKLRWSDGVRGNVDAASRDETDLSRYIDAQVPGEVHLDVWRAGWIQDPYVGTNCLAARWIEECIWAYRRTFSVPPAALKSRSWLVFEGLDLNAVIFLNGAEIGRHANAFHPCRVETTGKLRKGRNLLTVRIESGLFGVSDKPSEGYGPHRDQALHKRHWLRKPQCQFGWDWATRFINVGIHKPVRFEWTTDKVRVDQLVPLTEMSSDRQTGSLRARLFVEGLAPKPVRGEMAVEVVEAGVRVVHAVEIQPGLHPCEARAKVHLPKLWWPAGHGPQNLYTVRVTLSLGGRRVAERTARIGFRHVRVNQDAHPQGGRYFVLEVNGRKIFAKGGNFVPADMIFARLDRARYERLTDLALEANFNLLRVWGGGLYESDDFYELCDRKGLLVWQEFIFACSKYPATDEAFFDSVKAEAVHNIRRLASHPSLVAWCGNNEMEQGAWHWRYDRGIVLPDHALFHITLPRLLAEEDPTRYYQPSSPFSPDGLDPVRDDVGDQHPWSIGFANTDFRDYRKMACRFPNEGGVLGPTSLPTMRACVGDDRRPIGSLAWQVHDNSVDSWGEPSHAHQIVKNWLGRDIRDFSLEEFTYRGGLLQGEALREYCDNFRRRMFDSASAIFWMFNDCWPAARSWTIVDYYLRRTPSFHFVRRAMAPISVVLVEEGGEVLVFGINDTDQAVRAELRYGLFRLRGGLPRDHVVTVNLPPNASTPIGKFPRSEWKEPRATMAFAMLTRNGEPLARNRLYLPFFKDLRWGPARVRVKLEKGRAVFTSSAFAWGVCLDLDGEEVLPDNFFDIYPGIPHSIPWPKRRPPKVLKVGNLAR